MTRPRQYLVSFFRCLLGAAVYLMVMHVCISLHQMGLSVKKNMVILQVAHWRCHLLTIWPPLLCRRSHNGFLAKKEPEALLVNPCVAAYQAAF